MVSAVNRDTDTRMEVGSRILTHAPPSGGEAASLGDGTLITVGSGGAGGAGGGVWKREMKAVRKSVGSRAATAATPPPLLPQLVCARPARGRDVFTARCGSPEGLRGAQEGRAMLQATEEKKRPARSLKRIVRCCLRGDDWGNAIVFTVGGEKKNQKYL